MRKNNNIAKGVFILFAITTFLTVFVKTSEASFPDLKPTHWCYEKIINFQNRGYVDGDPNGNFRPDDTITRAEYVKIVNNFFGYDQNTTDEAPLKDVDQTKWYAPYINEAVKRGYITGYEDGSFKPNNPIRRQEATVILSKILQIDKEEYPKNHEDGLAQYTDGEEVESWAYTAIHSYSVHNFINGYTDGSLKILKNVTRAETVELLNILEQKIEIEEPDDNKKPGGGGGGGSITRTKMPEIVVRVLENGEVVVHDTALWVNASQVGDIKEFGLSGDAIEKGALVNITCESTNSFINELFGRNGQEIVEQYAAKSKKDEDYLANAFILTDGVQKVKAYAIKSKRESGIAELIVKVDTVSPIANGYVYPQYSEVDGTILEKAKEQRIKIFCRDVDLYDLGENAISGVDEETLQYAWYLVDGKKEVRVTDWASFASGDIIGLSNVEAPEEATEGMTYGVENGIYKLAVSLKDKAGNPFGTKTDTYKETTENPSGDIIEEETTIIYDFVTEVDVTGEPLEDEEEIKVEIGNNDPVPGEVEKDESGDAIDESGDKIPEDDEETKPAVDGKLDGDSITVDTLMNQNVTDYVVAIDPDGDEITYTVASKNNPKHGKVTINEETGKFEYIPDTNYKGKDSFTVTAKDENGGTCEIKVNVNVYGMEIKIEDKVDSTVKVTPVTITDEGIVTIEKGDLDKIEIDGYETTIKVVTSKVTASGEVIYEAYDGETISAPVIPNLKNPVYTWESLDGEVVEVSPIAGTNKALISGYELTDEPIEILVTAEDENGIKVTSKVFVNVIDRAPVIVKIESEGLDINGKEIDITKTSDYAYSYDVRVNGVDDETKKEDLKLKYIWSATGTKLSKDDFEDIDAIDLWDEDEEDYALIPFADELIKENSTGKVYLNVMIIDQNGNISKIEQTSFKVDKKAPTKIKDEEYVWNVNVKDGSQTELDPVLDTTKLPIEDNGAGIKVIDVEDKGDTVIITAQDKLGNIYEEEIKKPKLDKVFVDSPDSSNYTLRYTNLRPTLIGKATPGMNIQIYYKKCNCGNADCRNCDGNCSAKWVLLNKTQDVTALVSNNGIWEYQVPNGILNASEDWKSNVYHFAAVYKSDAEFDPDDEKVAKVKLPIGYAKPKNNDNYQFELLMKPGYSKTPYVAGKSLSEYTIKFVANVPGIVSVDTDATAKAEYKVYQNYNSNLDIIYIQFRGDRNPYSQPLTYTVQLIDKNGNLVAESKPETEIQN